MKLLEKKFIKIGNKKYPILKSVRAFIMFNELSGHDISQTNETIQDIIYFFYCCFYAGGTHITYEEFLDLIDNQPELISEFVELIKEIVEEDLEKKLKTV
jgi:hypothetical protein